MKGVAVAAVIIAALLGCIGMAMANAPLKPPLQYEQFCESQKISGTGVSDVSTTIVDKKIALEYYNTMAGDGDLEMDSTQAYSENAQKLQRNVSAINDSNTAALNLYENTKLTYNARNAPLVGGKYLNSKAFYGGIGADIKEFYSVNQMEKDQTAFFSSTAPSNVSPDSLKALGKADYDDGIAGQPGSRVSNAMGNDPAHLIGIDVKSSFNGTWGTDATWHKIFYKDIKAHEQFTGQFEAEKLIKFHELPVPEITEKPCAGIDC